MIYFSEVNGPRQLLRPLKYRSSSACCYDARGRKVNFKDARSDKFTTTTTGLFPFSDKGFFRNSLCPPPRRRFFKRILKASRRPEDFGFSSIRQALTIKWPSSLLRLYALSDEKGRVTALILGLVKLQPKPIDNIAATFYIYWKRKSFFVRFFGPSV